MLVKGVVKKKTNEVVRVSYYTDAKTRRRLKLHAAITDRSITEIVDEAVKTNLDKHAVIFQED